MSDPYRPPGVSSVVNKPRRPSLGLTLICAVLAVVCGLVGGLTLIGLPDFVLPLRAVGFDEAWVGSALLVAAIVFAVLINAIQSVGTPDVPEA